MSREQQKRRLPKREIKSKLITNIQECSQKYETLIIFYTPIVRSKFMNLIRRDLRNDSIFFIGSNKVMQVALGRTTEDEIKPGYHFISERLKGNCGICFTNRSKESIMEYFKTQVYEDFARSGFPATRDFVVPEGQLQFPPSLQLHLTQNGLPIQLKDGIISCTHEYTVCKKGERLTPQQARLLEYFDEKMATFEISVLCLVTNGKFEEINEIPDAEMEIEENEATN